MRSLLPLSLVIAASLPVCGNPSLPAPPAEGVQVINVTAKKYEFDPPTIRVKQGTKVQLKISATDHAHGFKLSDVPDSSGPSDKPGLVLTSPDCTKIEQGQSATVEFTAQTPGTYPFRCCVHCGWHHRAMKGEVVVEP